jgi:hypothetical protein
MKKFNLIIYINFFIVALFVSQSALASCKILSGRSGDFVIYPIGEKSNVRYCLFGKGNILNNFTCRSNLYIDESPIYVPNPEQKIYISVEIIPEQSEKNDKRYFICGSKQSSLQDYILKDETFAAIVQVIGVNLFLLISYVWVSGVRRHSNFTNWLVRQRSHLSSVQDKASLIEFYPIIDDLYFNAGYKARRKRLNIERSIAEFVSRHDLQPNSALSDTTVAELRERLLSLY